jgi:hypothetical protein
MMPVIRISDETWERLKAYARPLEDSAEDVVRLALDALDKQHGRSTKTERSKPAMKATTRRQRSNGEKLPQKEFRRPLLDVLREKGGKARVKEIRELLEPRMAPRLSSADYEQVSSGDPRWWNAVCWERNDLVKEGLLRGDSERGIWELSARGRDPADSSNARDNEPEASGGTWRDDIMTALKSIDAGHGAPLQKIYDNVRKIRRTADRSVPESLEATVRRTLEDNCADSEKFRGIDVFYMPKGKGAGVWGLRTKRSGRDGHD